MKIKRKTFSGGYKFKDFEGSPSEQLVELGIPEKVIIPLKQGFGKEVPPLVKPGDLVKAGQIIGRDDDSISTPVHSSVTGIVEEIKSIEYLRGKVNAIVIKSDISAVSWRPLEGYSTDWFNLPVEKIEELLYLSGVTSVNRGGIPTRFKSSNIAPSSVKHVIIHGIESEIYNISLPLLVQERNIYKFSDGVKILKKILPDAEFHLAFGKHREKISKIISDYLGDTFNFYELEPKYPQGFDEVLISTILGEHFPYGELPADIGVVVLNVQNVLKVYDAVTIGKPLIEKTVALCGPGFRENTHIKVRIGTSLEYIVKERIVQDKQLRFVMNSLLNGIVFKDLSIPLDRNISQIIAIPEKKEEEFLPFLKSKTKSINANLHGEKRACIFCGFCEEVCPVGIIPHLIYRYVQKDIIDETIMKLKVFSCVGCNLCGFICPSKINVGKYVKEGQRKLIEQGCEELSCKLAYVDLKGLDEYRGIK